LLYYKNKAVALMLRSAGTARLEARGRSTGFSTVWAEASRFRLRAQGDAGEAAQ
jgi:hypothetical protein